MIQGASAADMADKTLVLECLIQRLRCWRCWKAFQFILAPSEFDSEYLLRCEKCQALHVLSADDFRSGYFRFLRRQLSTSKASIRPAEEVAHEFRRDFEENWADRCACGGYFKFQEKPAPSCPYCGARSPRWVPWPIDEQPSPPLPLLNYSTPTEYAAYEPIPPFPYELPPLRKSSENGKLPPWLRHVGGVLIIAFLYLTLPIVWLSKFIGLFTKDNKRSSS